MAASTGNSAKAPWHLWVVGAVSLLWNLVGVTDFVMTQTKNKAYMSGFTPAQLDFYYGLPFWVVGAWGIAVLGGALGSLLLLFRKPGAARLFLASAVCMIITDIRNFGLADGMKIMGGPGALIFASVIFVIGILLLIYARSMIRRGVLR